ncbi:MAG: hypothetical protein ACOYLO_16205 [Ferruginibacter sp.]
MTKRLNLILAIILLLSSYSCVRAQDEEKHIISMLQEFYVAYNTVSANCGLNVLETKLDSLQQKYCSQKFRKELKKFYAIHGLDHDILINDVYTEDIENLKISVTKDEKRESTYSVSYFAVVTGMGNKKTNEKVQIIVTVVKEDGIYKIDNVLDD